MMPADLDITERLQDALAGTWSIEREIGRGGMGVVYLARDVTLDRPVAIKVLHPELAADPDQRARFLREARTGARLSHPNIVPIHAVEDHEEFVFFVMALVDGESVGEKLLREGPMDPIEAEQIVVQIGWALAYSHAMNLIHRDVTLDNILIERSTGRAVLADFGIAAEIDRASDVSLIGTPGYLAPEIIQGDAPTPQSDLYALGIVAWSMLAGRLPFIADDTPALLLQHVTEPIPSLASAAPRTPSRLVRAIELALQKDPASRPGSIEEWLDVVQSSSGNAALATPLQRWVGRWEYTKPFYALGMSVFAMLTARTASDLLQALTYYGAFSSYDSFNGGQVPTFLAIIAGVAIKVFGALVLVHLSLEVAALRRLARSGYNARDIQLVVARARDELRRNPPPSPSLMGRVVHDLGYLAGIGFAVIATSVLKYLWVFVDGPVGNSADFFYTIGQWLYVAFWSAAGFAFLVPPFRVSPDGRWSRIRDGFWSSALGAGVMRLAAFGLPTGGETPHTLHRPTELMLDLAIEDLWNALPEESRRSMQDAPGIASRLRRRVADAKEALRVIDASAARLGAEATAVRQRLVHRLDEGVTALERIRLLLARLGGAAASAGDFTAQLEDARAIERSLLEELGAHPGLLKQLKAGLQSPSPTPAPTPAG